MKEIKCPHCHKVFSVDESEYAQLLNQVRTDVFDDELHRRLEEIQKTKEAEHKAALSQLERNNDKEKAAKDSIIESLKQELANTEKAINSQIELAVAKKEQELNLEISKKSREISELQTKVSQNESDKKLALMEANQAAREQLQQAKDKANETLRTMENEITRLQNDVELNKQRSQNEILAIHEQYKSQISQSEKQHKRELDMKDEVIAQYRDFKAKQSTKMIGESLEVYCNNQFEMMVHPYLPSAEFGKDNDVIDGTKGDFVFRDIVDGIESVSIMFEMKNEADETQIKHKNSDFFKKLDLDRTKKNCEYAVLVSLLELDNDLYNNGIYAVPGYEKMYVVRPQQFLTIISLLVQTGRNTVKVKKELAEAKNHEIDVTHFEDKLNQFKSVFGKHVKDAASRYNSALDDIDKAIKQLQNMKEDLRLWVDHLYKAENNFEDITIRKLTHKNPTLKAKLDEARESNHIEVVAD
ncbi:MAG: DUF2130 domain-containing protein [Bacteroidales bacterium]|nr:DUF2130 domain-containing protein [Candidatus Sodaliphilus fimicaballi]